MPENRHSCLRNVVSMFHVIEKELEWRRKRGQLEGFETLKRYKPIVAIGAEQPLEDQRMMADYFRTCCFTDILPSVSPDMPFPTDGTDGLGGIHSSVRTPRPLHPSPHTTLSPPTHSTHTSNPPKPGNTSSTHPHPPPS